MAFSSNLFSKLHCLCQWPPATINFHYEISHNVLWPSAHSSAFADIECNSCRRRCCGPHAHSHINLFSLSSHIHIFIPARPVPCPINPQPISPSPPSNPSFLMLQKKRLVHLLSYRLCCHPPASTARPHAHTKYKSSDETYRSVFS